MRLALSLGMHRSASTNYRISPVERERRKRTWWMIYFFERILSLKLGQPISIRDEDIDVELPTMDDLTEDEKKEFTDPSHVCENVRLARIAGNICEWY